MPCVHSLSCHEYKTKRKIYCAVPNTTKMCDLQETFWALKRGNPLEVWVTSEQKLCTKTIYKLHIQRTSYNTKCRKQILKLVGNAWKYWRNEIEDKIFLSMFAQFLWTLKLIFSSCHWRLFFVLYQASNNIFGF